MPKQRTSKSWYVTVEGTTEEIKIVGVSTPEAAMARAVEQGHVALSARPMRKFKSQAAPQAQEVTPVARGAVVMLPPDTEVVADVDPSTL